jgi:hypothetical protein
MSPKIRCKHCHRVLVTDPRVKNQQYCGRKVCQRARKARWQRRKMAADADYRKNQQDCRQQWSQSQPEYWRRYRSRHPQYCERNRQLQKVRDAKRKARRLAKMDASKQINNMIPGGYYIFPVTADLAKMDALMQKIYIIPEGCIQPARSCKKGLDVHPKGDWLQCGLLEVRNNDAHSLMPEPGS